MNESLPQQVKYFVEVANVQDVTLVGSADADFWREKLAEERLYPYLHEGRAELMVVANNARWMGLRFSEMVFTVLASTREDGSTRDGSFLIQGFSSRYFFAWSERTFFGTPYRQGTILVDEKSPAAMRLQWGKTLLWQAEMGAERASIREADEGFEGRVYLPLRGKKPEAAKMFFARIAGDTIAYPFDKDRDRMESHAHPDLPVFEWLNESGFEGREWQIRASCTHARSKTVARDDTP